MPASERVARAAINSKEKAMLAKSPKRAALYVRVSTDKQTVQNQIEALTAIAEGRGWTIIETYSDVGISGAKGRRDRPGLDRMLNDASRAVEHMNVHPGGQAVVGVVEAPGGGVQPKSEDQAHAREIAHAPQPALP